MKCDLKKALCPAMESAAQANPSGSSYRGKGLSLFRTTNRSSGKTRLAGILYKTTATHTGIMLNCCPFCLADYTEHLKQFTKKEAA